MKISKPKWQFITCVIPLTIAIIIAMACAEKAKKEPPKEAKELLKQTETLKVKQQEKREELKGMSIPQIVSRLEDESSKGVEPFNSIAYRELVSRGSKIAPELKNLITKPERASLLSLLALQEIDPGIYDTVDTALRIQTLIDSLRTSDHFNTWGLPHLYWESAAKAIIEHGKVAIDALKPLLKDKRAAPVWGSEEVLEYQKYQYRVCDYAMALINAITQRKIEIPTDPEARDKIIDEMISKLQ